MILATYREPFGFSPHVRRLPEGETLSQMRDRMSGLPADFDDCGVICLNGHAVPRELWGVVRPKTPAITEVTFHTPPQGGGGDGKNPFATIASIALTVVSGGIAGGSILGGLTGAGQLVNGVRVGATFTSLMLAAGVSLGGSLLLSALIPPPSIDTRRGRSVQNPGAASAEGNVLDPNGPIPRVVGERKVYPPLASEPFTYFSGPDEVVEAAYILAGPHRIRDIRLGAASLDSVVDIDYEVREGWQGDPLISMMRRQARTEAVQAELRAHIVSDEDGRTVSTNTGDNASAMPQVQIVATRDAPDEHQLQLTFGQGLHRNGSDTDRIRVPLRLRMRPVGGEWINLPELHFQAANMRPLRTTIRLVWTSSLGVAPGAANAEGWIEARSASPGQSVVPTSAPWSAHPYFSGVGASYMDASNLGTTGLRHVTMDRYTAHVLLDPAVFPRGRYEIEVQRGAAFQSSNYSASAYTYGGSVWNFWGVQGSPGQIVMSREQVLDTLYLVRSVSIWNEHPLPSRDLAVVAVRARNRAVERVSCVAGGWVRDWSGAAWDVWSVTSNPAPHLRDIWVGAENLDPVPEDLIDDAGLLVWRQHCIDQGYTCNALIEDQSLDDAARIVAACGYAKPMMSDIWSVVRDYDRSGEAPVQMFTPRNMSGFQWTKGFARVPEGFRVNFRDSTRDYDIHQISVFRPGNSNDSGRMEQITLEGIVHEADAVRRAQYDQDQAQLRSTFYSWDCAAESVLCRRGDLVAAQSDMLHSRTGSARVVGIIQNGGLLVVGLELDSFVDIEDAPDLLSVGDLLSVADMLALGAETVIMIRRDSGVTSHTVSSVSGNTVFFSPPISPAGISEGTLVGWGPLEKSSLRLIVFDVTPGPNFTATITAVDEASQLWV